MKAKRVMLKPRILLPAKLLKDYHMADLKMMLAHELAHLKRYDLFWNWIFMLGRILFFFHPLVYLIQADWQQAQESCCDYLALQFSKTAVIDYGLPRKSKRKYKNMWLLPRKGR